MWFVIAFPAGVGAGIWNFFMVLMIARLLFAKDTMGELNTDQLIPADETSSLTSIRETAHTLMNHLAYETPGCQFIVWSVGIQTQAKWL